MTWTFWTGVLVGIPVGCVTTFVWLWLGMKADEAERHWGRIVNDD